MASPNPHSLPLTQPDPLVDSDDEAEIMSSAKGIKKRRIVLNDEDQEEMEGIPKHEIFKTSSIATPTKPPKQNFQNDGNEEVIVADSQLATEEDILEETKNEATSANGNANKATSGNDDDASYDSDDCDFLQPEVHGVVCFPPNHPSAEPCCTSKSPLPTMPAKPIAHSPCAK